MFNSLLKLGYHTHIPAVQKKDRIYMPGHMGFFVDEIAKRCSSLICFQHSPLKEELEQMDYPLESSNVILFDMGEHARIPLRTINAFKKIPEIKKKMKGLDAIIIRTPTPLLPIFRMSAKDKIILYIVGDYLAGIDSLNLPTFKKKIIKVWSRWIDKNQLELAKNNLTFVNGRHLYLKLKDKIPTIKEIHTTTLREKDFFIREDTCTTPPYRLLYSGRIVREKGVFDLIRALLKLVKSGKDVVLELVGNVEKEDFLREIMKFASENQMEKRVIYYGYKPAGEELLSYYRKADIFVCPTQIPSETYPRTIREAMASSLPVVATKVGSLPFYIGDCSILVEPKDVSSLTLAILRLLEDRELRKEIIKKGLEIVRDDTVEKKADELIADVEKWLKGKTT